MNYLKTTNERERERKRIILLYDSCQHHSLTEKNFFHSDKLKVYMMNMHIIFFLTDWSDITKYQGDSTSDTRKGSIPFCTQEADRIPGWQFLPKSWWFTCLKCWKSVNRENHQWSQCENQSQKGSNEVRTTQTKLIKKNQF